MTYYILMDGDSEKDTLYSSNILGEESFGSFYPDSGFYALVNIVKNNPKLIESILIINDKKERLTVDEFLNKLDNLKIKKM